MREIARSQQNIRLWKDVIKFKVWRTRGQCCQRVFKGRGGSLNPSPTGHPTAAPARPAWTPPRQQGAEPSRRRRAQSVRCYPYNPVTLTGTSHIYLFSFGVVARPNVSAEDLTTYKPIKSFSLFSPVRHYDALYPHS